MWPFNRRLPAPERPGSTFQQLGAPFPLFDAPASNAEDYCGPATCSICGQQASVCFRLGIGCALIVPCPSCRTENGLDAFEGKPQACRDCKSVITFPLPRRARAITCYACLRAGRAAMTKDTVLGMISWDQAFEGLTHGRPRLSRPDFEMVPTESDWVRAPSKRDDVRTLAHAELLGNSSRPMAILLPATDDLSRRMDPGGFQPACARRPRRSHFSKRSPGRRSRFVGG